MTDETTAPPAPDAVESEARSQGWRPREEFAGPETAWVDADTFVQRGREILPIVQSQLRKERANVARLAAEQDALKKTVAEFAAHHANTAQREYQRAMDDLKAQRHQAMEDGDLSTAVMLEKQMEVVAHQSATHQQQAPRVHTPDPVASEDLSDLHAWTESKPWFAVDRMKTGLAVTMAQKLRDDRPDLQGNGPAFLAELDRQLVVQFPNQFGVPGNRMEGPGPAGLAPSGRGMKRTKAHLPPEARQAMDKFVKEGLLTEAQYLAEYQWDA